jgi:hypothetical protein
LSRSPTKRPLAASCRLRKTAAYREPPPFTKKVNADHTTLADFLIRPCPGARRVLPSVTPHDRRRRLQPDAECATLVDVGALGGDIIRRALAGETITFKSDFFDFQNVRVTPEPIQKPRPPIWLGGFTPAALRRAVRFGDGFHRARCEPRCV